MPTLSNISPKKYLFTVNNKDIEMSTDVASASSC